MDAQQALADLTEISSQIQAALVFDEGGKVAASTLGDEQRAEELARAAGRLLEHADEIGREDASPTQLEVATLEGSVFVVRNGAMRIVATTGPDPTVGLVFYDLKSALRQIEAEPPPKRRASARKPPPAPAKPKPKASRTPRAPKKTSTPRRKPDAP